MDSKPEKVLRRIQNKTAITDRIFSEQIDRSLASALMLDASAQLEHTSHNRENKLSKDATDETVQIVNAIMWIDHLANSEQDCYTWSWSYLSAAVKVLDVVGHGHYLVPVLKKMLLMNRGRFGIHNPSEPAWCKLKSSTMLNEVLI